MGKGGCKGGNGVPALEFQPWHKERGSISTHPPASVADQNVTFRSFLSLHSRVRAGKLYNWSVDIVF